MAIPRYLDPNAQDPNAYAAGLLGNVYQNGPQTGQVSASPIAPQGLLPAQTQSPGIMGRIAAGLANPAINQRLMAFGAEALANSGYQQAPVTTGAGLGRSLQAMNQAGLQYSEMIAKGKADEFNKRIKEAELAKLQADTRKVDKEAAGSADPYLSAFGDSAEGRQLAIMASQYQKHYNTSPQDAVTAVARWNQEKAPSAVAIPAGGELRTINTPSLFDAPPVVQPGQPAPAMPKSLSVGPPIAARPPEQKQLPQNLLDALQNNAAQLRMLDQIETLVNDPKAAASLGAQNMLPGIDTVAKYFRSPDQNTLTGLISGMQSMAYKDISGANVTASEEPRLQRYVPAVTDNPETVRNKVKNFSNEYRTIQREIEAIAEQQGYKPVALPTAEGAKPKGSAPKPGEVVGGYKFKGGNPKDKANWVRQ